MRHGCRYIAHRIVNYSMFDIHWVTRGSFDGRRFLYTHPVHIYVYDYASWLHGHHHFLVTKMETEPLVSELHR